MIRGLFGMVGGALALASLTGCSEDDEFDCTKMPSCDVSQASCQSRVFTATACARQQQGSMPPVRTLTRSQVEIELRQQVAEDPTLAPSPWEKALQLLGLIPQAPLIDVVIGSFVENAIAYYDPTADRVTVISDNASGANALFVLSHEFVHALQDQDVDLIAFQRQARSTDASAAVDALIEGEAMIHPNVLLARSQGASPDQIDWQRYAGDILTEALATMDAAPSPFVEATSLLAYPVGLRFLIGPWLAEGQPAIDRFYETPLLSFRQWAFASAGQPLGENPLTCFPSVPPPGFTAFDHDRLGTAGLIGLRARNGRGASSGFDAGFDLLDDSVVVFTSAADPAAVAVAWRLRFTNSDPAVESYDPAEPASRERVIGDELLILRATDPALLDAWTTAADCGRAEDLPVPPEQLEKPSALVRRLLR